jgi:uncharacterized membrane protein (DUF4010 family)
MSLEAAWELLGAMLCGALIGMQREFVGQREPRPAFAGVRTLTLVALLGALSTQLGAQLGWWLPCIAFIGLVVLVSISHYLRQAADPGLTTEVVSLLTFLVGVTMVEGAAQIAVSVTIVMTGLLSIKKPLHEFARRLSEADVNATLKFALISLVILPLLPNRALGPYGVLNPYTIWLMVVLISGISFLGYILIQFAGPTRGLALTGFLGGVVSSTAVALDAAQRSRASDGVGGPLALSALIASTVLFPRTIVVIGVVNPRLLPTVGWALGGMGLVGAAACIVLARRVRSSTAPQPPVEFTNPFLLRAAIRFGVLFAVVLVAVQLAQRFLGAMGLYLTGLLAGLTDVDAITLSMARMSAAGTPALLAARTIVVAVLANTVVKAAILWLMGRRTVAWPATPGFIVVTLTGIVALLVMR